MHDDHGAQQHTRLGDQCVCCCVAVRCRDTGWPGAPARAQPRNLMGAFEQEAPAPPATQGTQGTQGTQQGTQGQGGNAQGVNGAGIAVRFGSALDAKLGDVIFYETNG